MRASTAVALAATFAACASLACSGEGDETSSSGGGGASSGGASSGGAACRTSLASGLRTSPVPGAPANGRRAVLAANAAGGSLVAWASGGQVHVSSLDAAGAQARADLVAPGDAPYGVADSGGTVAILTSRAPDFMTFVAFDGAGAVAATKNLVGGGNHATVGVEWFGEFANTGRLVATDGGFAAYFGIHRRWPDNVGHQGDTLRLLGKDGAPRAGAGWDWGCSHSLDQRLVFDGKSAQAMCVSDCYPTKGVLLNNRQAVISDEPSGNCAGKSDSSLGGLARTEAGLAATFVSKSATGLDVAFARIDAAGKPGAKTFVTSGAGASRPMLAAFEGGFLAGWESKGKRFLAKLDAAGAAVGAPEEIPGAWADGSDFVTYPNGDVGWLTAGASLGVTRLAACPK